MGKSSVPGRFGYGSAVYVWGIDCDRSDLTRVARAITDNLYDQRFAVRFCDPEHDCKNRCVYCHAPRSDVTDYLCKKHQKEDATLCYKPQDYDFRDIEYAKGEAEE